MNSIILPILFRATDRNFLTNGLGVLSDALYCVVQHEINGTFEMEMTYPVDGQHFDEIQKWRLIYSPFDETGNRQLFEIYRITKPLNGKVSIYAWHVSYKLNHTVVKPFTADSVATAIMKLKSEEIIASEFTFATDKDTVANMNVQVPTATRSLMGGMEGSFIDTFGGEWDFNNFTCTLRNRLGRDSGVTIKYGKNLTNINADSDVSNFWTAAVGYWKSEEEVVYSDVMASAIADSYPERIIKTIDATMSFDEKPTKQQLNAWTQNYVNSNAKMTEAESIEVSFVQLWQTEEYKEVAPLQRVSLGDTVHIEYPKYGISGTSRVISYRYNVLAGRYDSMTLGSVKSNLSNSIKQDVQAEVGNSENLQRTFFEKAIETATQLITGGLGGYVVLNTDANGYPNEILIMNTPDKETATRVMRINYEGIAFGTGYNGPFNSTWTSLDGTFNAENINVINLNAASLVAGILKDKGNNNYWNLDTGEFRLASTKVTVDGTSIENYAKDAASEEISDFAETVLAEDIERLQEQIDEKIITWYLSGEPTLANQPAVGWTDDATKEKHIGDLYYDLDTGKSYIFEKFNNTYSWNNVSDNDIAIAMATAANAQDTADGKRRVFISQPVPPYDVGDLWCEGNSGDIKTCTTAKAEGGTFDATDWSKLNKYTDDTAVTALNNALTQQEIFNRLTNNGTIQGIYMSNGQLYINATYIATGKIASKNGRVYFDLDNNELHCNEIIDTKNETPVAGYVGKKTILSQDGQSAFQAEGFLIYRQLSGETYPRGLGIDIGNSATNKPNATITSPSGLAMVATTNCGFAATRNAIVISPHCASLDRLSASKIDTLWTYAGSRTTGDYEAYLLIDDNYNVALHALREMILTADKITLSTSQVSMTSAVASSIKSRVVDTEDYERRLLYCYEMPSPMFGDIGEGFLDENGECYVDIDDIFNETITSDIEYQVFLQKEGQGDLWIEEKNPSYFVVKGTPSLKFSWELKAKQMGFEKTRLENIDLNPDTFEIKEDDLMYEIYDSDISDYFNGIEEALNEETF